MAIKEDIKHIHKLEKYNNETLSSAKSLKEMSYEQRSGYIRMLTSMSRSH